MPVAVQGAVVIWPFGSGKIISNHIRVRRMWNYAHQHLELTFEEHEHVLSCKSCLSLFRFCLLAKDPEQVDRSDEDEQSQKKSA